MRRTAKQWQALINKKLQSGQPAEQVIGREALVRAEIKELRHPPNTATVGIDGDLGIALEFERLNEFGV